MAHNKESDIIRHGEIKPKLKKSEMEVKYQAELIEKVSDAIISTDLDFNIISWNKAAKSIYGWKANETIGKNIMDIIPMEYSDDDEESVVKQFFEEGFWKGEVIQPRKDGTLLNILASVSIIKDDEYNPIGTVAINRDITERKREEQKLKAEEKIKEQNAFLTNVIEALTHPFYIINVNDYTIEMANSAANFGDLSGEEKCFILTHQNDKPCSGEHPCPITMVKNTKSPALVEHIHYNDKGDPRNFDIHGYPIFDENGEIIQMIEYAIDVTKQRKAEEKLKESEEKYRLLFESSPVGIGISDFKGNVVAMNKRMSEMTGFTLEELKDIGLAATYVDQNEREKLLNELERSGQVRNYGVKLKKRDGTNYFTSLNIDVIELGGEKFFFTNQVDITERKKAEEERNLNSEIMTNLAEGIYLIRTSDLTIVYANRRFEEMFGYNPGEMIGKRATIVNALNNKNPEETAEEIVKVLEKTGEWHGEVNNIKKDGTPFWCYANVSLFNHPEFGEVLVAVHSDITERKVAEQKLKVSETKYRTELEKKVIKRTKKLKESEEKYREAYNRGNFYKDLFAHDINNIMQVINSSTELISYKFDETEKSINIEELTIMIKKQITRAKELVKNVILLSDLEEIHQPIKLTEVCELLRNSINFIYNSFPEREINIQIESLNKTFFVQANELLQDVFENILTNGAKYNEKNTVELEIKLSKAHKEGKNYLKIEFRDNGIGIADDRKAIIFEKGHKKLKGFKGMGLGLSLVKKILTIYDGKIWVEDRVRGDYNQGSNFILLIPQ